ncbi:MAG: hypothetical protein ACK4WM_08335 [Thermoflexales bacterium]
MSPEHATLRRSNFERFDEEKRVVAHTDRTLSADANRHGSVSGDECRAMIVIPAVVLVLAVLLATAFVANLLRRRRWLAWGMGLGACALVIAVLVGLAGGPLRTSLLSLDPGIEVAILGRVLALTPTSQPALIMLSLAALIVIGFAPAAGPADNFYSLGLGILALLATSLMVQPLPYAAFAWQASATVAVFLIQGDRAGERSGQAALRYLAAFTFTLPLLLLAGWLSDQARSLVPEAAQLAQAYNAPAALIAAAMLLLMGAVPLYSWLHLVARDAAPPVTALLATLVSGTVAFLWLSLWEANDWLRDSALASGILRFSGMALLAISTLTGWAQPSFARWLGSALFAEAGTSLLLMQPRSPLEVEAQVVGVLSRALALALFAAGLHRLRQQCGSTRFDALSCRPDSWTLVALAISGLSLAGVPATSGFVWRWLLARGLGESELMLLVALSSASLIGGLVRGLSAALGARPSAVVDASEAVSDGLNSKTDWGPRLLAAGAMLSCALGVVPTPLIELAAAIARGYTFYP